MILNLVRKVVTDEEDGGETSSDVHVVGGPGEAGAKLPGSKKSHESNLDQRKERRRKRRTPV